MTNEQYAEIQQAISDVEHRILDMERKEEEVEQKMDEFYGGHGPGYDPDSDLWRSRNLGTILSIFEKHRTHPLFLRWLADNLSKTYDMIPYFILQTLDNVLYDTPPVVTSDDIYKDSQEHFCTPVNYYRDWPKLLEGTYREKLTELRSEKYRQEWGRKFFRDLESKLNESVDTTSASL